MRYHSIGEGLGITFMKRDAEKLERVFDPVIEAYKKDIDRSLLRENLKLTPEERILKLMDVLRFTLEVRKAGRGAKPTL